MDFAWFRAPLPQSGGPVEDSPPGSCRFQGTAQSNKPLPCRQDRAQSDLDLGRPPDPVPPTTLALSYAERKKKYEQNSSRFGRQWQPSDRTSDLQRGDYLLSYEHTLIYTYALLTIFALMTKYALRYRLQLQTWTRERPTDPNPKNQDLIKPPVTYSHHRASRFSQLHGTSVYHAITSISSLSPSATTKMSSGQFHECIMCALYGIFGTKVWLRCKPIFVWFYFPILSFELFFPSSGTSRPSMVPPIEHPVTHVIVLGTEEGGTLETTDCIVSNVMGPEDGSISLGRSISTAIHTKHRRSSKSITPPSKRREHASNNLIQFVEFRVAPHGVPDSSLCTFHESQLNSTMSPVSYYSFHRTSVTA